MLAQSHREAWTKSTFFSISFLNDTSEPCLTLAWTLQLFVYVIAVTDRLSKYRASIFSKEHCLLEVKPMIKATSQLVISYYTNVRTENCSCSLSNSLRIYSISAFSLIPLPGVVNLTSLAAPPIISYKHTLIRRWNPTSEANAVEYVNPDIYTYIHLTACVYIWGCSDMNALTWTKTCHKSIHRWITNCPVS